MATPSDENTQAGKEAPGGLSRRARTFHLGSILTLIIGVALSTFLILYHNFSSVVAATQRIGWGFALVLLIQVSGIALNGLAWRALFRSERPGFSNTLIVLRWIRESINYLLPVGRLGGDMAAARLLAARGRDVNTVVAGIVADKTLEVLGLFIFALVGIVVLFESGNGNFNSIENWAVRALGAIFAVLVAFFAAQRWGLLKLIDKAVGKFSGRWGGGNNGDSAGIHDIVWAIYADIPRLLLAALLHAVAWVPGALQIWVAMHFMGLGTGLAGAYIIESMTQIACAAAFMMPASLGAQEAAYMTIGWWIFGVPPAAGLALSLVQRMKDVLFGVPGLLAWQGFEGNRLWSLWRRREK